MFNLLLFTPLMAYSIKQVIVVNTKFGEIIVPKQSGTGSSVPEMIPPHLNDDR